MYKQGKETPTNGGRRFVKPSDKRGEMSIECSNAAECDSVSDLALVGCTVAPGFEFSEFELADVDALLQQFPQHRDVIVRLGPAGPIRAPA